MAKVNGSGKSEKIFINLYFIMQKAKVRCESGNTSTENRKVLFFYGHYSEDSFVGARVVDKWTEKFITFIYLFFSFFIS